MGGYAIRFRSDSRSEQSPVNDFLMHYGVSGQRWGVTTKEYEPVDVDHRTSPYRTHQMPQSHSQLRPRGISQIVKNRQAQRQRERREYIERTKAEIQANRERRRRIQNIVGYGGAALATLLVAYGAHKYSKGVKMKAYSGVLSRFIAKNPNASVANESSKQVLRKGLDLAKANSRTLKDARHTNKYLKSIGLLPDKQNAERFYRYSKFVKRAANMKTGTNTFTTALEKYRKKRIMSKAFDAFYFK